VVIAVRLFYDTAVAVALVAVAALVCGLVAAVVTGGSSPNLPVATIAFLLTGGFMFFRLRRILREFTQ
jgi:zinc transporter ZupT